MHELDKAVLRSRLESFERELLSIAGNLDSYETDSIRDMTFADIEAHYVLESLQVVRIRKLIIELKTTIETL